MKRSLFVSDNLSSVDEKRVLNELKLGYLNLEDEMFEQAKLNFQLVLQIDKKNADAYWGLMLVKFQLTSEELLFSDAATYKSAIYLPEYLKAMEFAQDRQSKIYEGLMQRIYEINQGDNY